jgi:hypothetical protein
MSFRLFVYYGALIGAWMAMLGWLVGRWITDRYFNANEQPIAVAAMRALFLGACVAFGLGLLDALWNVGWRNILQVLGRLGVAILIGGLGGLAGGSLAMALVVWTNHETSFFVAGWALVGTALGASVSALEFVVGRLEKKSRFATAKFLKCMLGGAIGGLIGGVVALLVRQLWLRLFADKSPDLLWSPYALGFVALGLFIGLLVGLAQVILKEAWIKVERGFRPGREVLLAKDRTVIGRAEGSDIPMFGDAAVDKTHAYLLVQGTQYTIEDAGSSTGTFVNDRRIAERTVLHSGDLIRVGQNVMRFSERQKR